jgi:hypothetical protein
LPPSLLLEIVNTENYCFEVFLRKNSSCIFLFSLSVVLIPELLPRLINFCAAFSE